MRVYKVVFLNQGKVYEVYAKAVHQGELYGFVEIEGLIFGDSGTLVVDPEAERLKNEFKGVSRSMVPIHSMIRIDEVEKEGQSRIREVGDKTNVTPFPTPLYTPDRGPEK